MRDLDAAFLASLADAGVDDFAFLVTIKHDDLPTLYYALDTRTITWGPTAERFTYVANRGEWGVIRNQLEQEPPEVTLKLQNLDDTWTNHIHGVSNLNLNGALVDLIIIRIGIDPTDKATSLKSRIAETTWTVSGVVLTDDSVTFSLGQRFGVLGYSVPNPPLGGLFCRWHYKSPQCGSVSPLKTCNKSLDACRERFPILVALRFSEFPYMDGRRTTF